MAGTDKINEFYTCIDRLCYLSKYYKPENLPKEINDSLERISDFIFTNKDFKERIDQAEEYFQDMNERNEQHKRKDLLAFIVKECTK